MLARYIRTAGGKVLDVLDRAGLRGLATGTVAAVLAELYVDLRVLRLTPADTKHLGSPGTANSSPTTLGSTVE